MLVLRDNGIETAWAVSDAIAIAPQRRGAGARDQLVNLRHPICASGRRRGAPAPSAVSVAGVAIRSAVYVPLSGSFGDARRLVALCEQAEQSGWDGFFTWDVLYSGVEPMLDPWVVLSACAARTNRITLGALVTPVARRRDRPHAPAVGHVSSAGRRRVAHGGSDGGRRGRPCGRRRDHRAARQPGMPAARRLCRGRRDVVVGAASSGRRLARRRRRTSPLGSASLVTAFSPL